MSQKNYPGYPSIFFKNLPTNHYKRLEQSTYRQVLDQVSSLYLKLSPRNCSQNTRITYSDIDRTQEHIKSQQRSSSLYASQELSKLNNPIRPIQETSEKPKRNSIIASSKIKPILSNRRPCKAEKADADLYDTVIGKCDTFKPELLPKKKEINSHAFYRLNTSGAAYHYIQDLSECLKNTDDQERIKNMMSTMNYNRNTDVGLKNELRYIKDELLETTNKIVKMTPYKLWRQNNIAFMSNADKMIASFPTVKN